MNLPVRFRGLPVSEGTALGVLHIADDQTAVSATPEEVRDAFAAVAAERFALADRLRAAGRETEAAIIEIGGLMAADPLLADPAVAAVRVGGDAAAAVRQAAETQAAVLEALPNRELAERAGDVRQVAHAVLDRLGQAGAASRPAGDFILVRREVSPADLIELAEAGLVGAVSVAGGASSHAAIIARGLGVPMIARTDPAVLAAPAGQPALLDADAGELLVGPGATGLPAALAGHDASHDAGQRQPGPNAPVAPARPTGARSRSCATSPPRPKPGAAWPRGRPGSVCCAPRSPTLRRWPGRPRPSSRPSWSPSSACSPAGPPRSGCLTSPATRSRRSCAVR
jgi:phosphoenolpyruvate-protein kinase (PTS system EI component)